MNKTVCADPTLYKLMLYRFVLHQAWATAVLGLCII